MYHPDMLYVFFDQYVKGITATRIAGQISFTNKGDAGHNAIISDLSAVINVGGKSIEENWLSFATITGIDTQLKFEIKGSVHPVVVEGGNASSYMVTFAPQMRDCSANAHDVPACNRTQEYVSDVDFIKALSGSKSLTVTFEGSLVDSGTKLKSTCAASITDEMIRTIAMNNWYGAKCVSTR
jgi:hypothetical protein